MDLLEKKSGSDNIIFLFKLFIGCCVHLEKRKSLEGFIKPCIIWPLINSLTSFLSTFPLHHRALATLASDVLDVPACLPPESLHWRFLLPFLRWLHNHLLHFCPVFAQFYLLKKPSVFNTANFPTLSSHIHLPFSALFLLFFHSNDHIQTFYIIHFFSVLPSPP